MFSHTSVLLSEVQDILSHIDNPAYIIDATLGLGGHTSMMLPYVTHDGFVFGFDRDMDNLRDASEYIAKQWFQKKFVPIHGSFDTIDEVLDWYNIQEIDFVLYDLWVSSAHYDDGIRGFSTRFDGPLDMRFDRSSGRTAEDIVMTFDERELMQIFVRYADEKKALFIARAICDARKTQKIDTTSKLLDIIDKSSFDKKSGIRVFQALRIAVNDEFWHIERSLAQALRRLKVGGKIAVITFHSIEDRLVKNIFSEYTRDVINELTGQTQVPASFRKYTKKPIEPTEEEIQSNTRSRSAKMRVLEKVHPVV